MVKRNGFTIVELLIVIVVIAVLAAITIVAFNGVQKRATASRANSEMSQIVKAIEAYEAVHGEYPPDIIRGIPPEISSVVNINDRNWPDAPWPGSTYDYDNWTSASSGKQYVQLGVRFCPYSSSSLADCKFPNEPWANGFQLSSSYYWCMKGPCQAHGSVTQAYPAYCVNCPEGKKDLDN